MKIGTRVKYAMILFVAAAASAMGASASAQQSSGQGQSAGSFASLETAPVVIDGETIFRVRGVSAYPAARRAKVISERIEEVAADDTIDPDSVRISENRMGLGITAGDRFIMTIVDADAEFEGLRIDLLVDVTKERIIHAIRTYRAERSSENLRDDAKHAAAALALTLIIISGFYFGSRLLLRIVDRQYNRFTESMKIQSFEVIRADRIHAVIKGLVQFFRTIVIGGVTLVCIVYVLNLFPWTRAVTREILDFVGEPLRIVLTSIIGSIPNLMFIVIIVLLVRFILRLVRAIFQAIEIGRIRFARFEPQWAMPTYKLVRLGIIAFSLAIAYPYIPGSDSAAFKGVSIFAGVILSLGSSSVISNIIAGYTMIYRSAYDVGDWIQIGDSVGEVVDRRLLVTHLRSRKNEALVVPNSRLMNMEIVNYSELAEGAGLILHTTVGIGYEVQWRQVERMLLEAAGRTDGLRSDRAPFILQKSLGDFCVTYELNVYCGNPKFMPELYSNLHRNILDVFNENGVQIMTPAYVADPAKPKVAPVERESASTAKPRPSA